MFSHHKMHMDKVLEFHVDESVLVERVEGRRIHQASGRSYHLKFNPPKVEGMDDVTGEPLMHRKDDTAEALHKRMASYNTQTAPILEYYRARNILTTLNATASINEVEKQISESLHAKMLWEPKLPIY